LQNGHTGKSELIAKNHSNSLKAIRQLIRSIPRSDGILVNPRLNILEASRLGGGFSAQLEHFHHSRILVGHSRFLPRKWDPHISGREQVLDAVTP